MSLLLAGRLWRVAPLPPLLHETAGVYASHPLMDRNRRLRLVRRAITILFCVACLAAMWVVARSPAILEWRLRTRRRVSDRARAVPHLGRRLVQSRRDRARRRRRLLRRAVRLRVHPRASPTAGLTNALAGGLLRVCDGGRGHPRLLLSLLGPELRARAAAGASGMAADRDDADPAERQRQIDEIATHGGGARRGDEHRLSRSRPAATTSDARANGRPARRASTPSSTSRLRACSSGLGPSRRSRPRAGAPSRSSDEPAHELPGARGLLLSVDRRGQLQPSDAGAIAAALGRARESASTRHRARRTRRVSSAISPAR